MGSAANGYGLVIALLALALSLMALFAERPINNDKHRTDYKRYFLQLVTFRILGASMILAIGYGLIYLLYLSMRAGIF